MSFLYIKICINYSFVSVLLECYNFNLYGRCFCQAVLFSLIQINFSSLRFFISPLINSFHLAADWQCGSVWLSTASLSFSNCFLTNYTFISWPKITAEQYLLDIRLIKVFNPSCGMRRVKYLWKQQHSRVSEGYGPPREEGGSLGPPLGNVYKIALK